MYKKIFIYIFFLSLLVNIGNLNAQERIAFVDINYVYNNSIIGKKINKDIKNKTNDINNEFEKNKKRFNKTKKDLLSKKNVLSKEEFEKKLNKLENDIQEYNQLILKKNKDLKNYKNKAQIQFNKNLQVILENFSKSNSLDMIISKQNILIGKKNLDATVNILDLFNKEVKDIKVE